MRIVRKYFKLGNFLITHFGDVFKLWNLKNNPILSAETNGIQIYFINMKS